MALDTASSSQDVHKPLNYNTQRDGNDMEINYVCLINNGPTDNKEMKKKSAFSN